MTDKKSILIHLPFEVKEKLRVKAAQNSMGLKNFIEQLVTGSVAGEAITIPHTEVINPAVGKKKKTVPSTTNKGSY